MTSIEITLRDHIATEAMKSFINNTTHFAAAFKACLAQDDKNPTGETFKLIARASYEMADYMMDARKAGRAS